MPYKGSKNQIAEKLISVLPKSEYFVDLFGGGGAMTDCALQSGKHQKAIYNEIEPLIANGFKMAVNGKFKGEKRWISREDFFKLKDTDPYVAMCFSFGNDLKTYCYGRKIENYKHALHELIVNRNIQPILEYSFADKEDCAKLCEIEDMRERRIAYRSTVLEEAKRSGKVYKKGSHYYYNDMVAIEFLQSLQSLERLERLQSLEIYNLSYEEVEIPENAVVYCDIPYKDTNKYINDFDYDKFYEWCRNQKNTVFISEYNMPDDFYTVAELSHRGSLSATNNAHYVTEKLFCNKEVRRNESRSNRRYNFRRGESCVHKPHHEKSRKC